MLAQLQRFVEAHSHLIGWLSGASLLLLVGGALLGPWLVLRLPADTFLPQASVPAGARSAQRDLFVLVLRNLLGALLVMIGVLLLVLPGQGLLTILAGFFLMDFPGKRKWLARLVARPKVQRSLNWFRRKFGRAPFEFAECTLEDS